MKGMNYGGALNIVKTARDKTKKPIANNTWLILDNATKNIAVRLHHTDILTYQPDGGVILDTGGWKTVTTKARMNAYLLDGYVGSTRGTWIYSKDGTDYFYEDGMRINPDGTVEGEPVFASKLEKITGKSMNTLAALVKGIQELSIEELVKVWKRFKNDRALIASHCRLDFLPLTIGTERKSVYGGAYYQDESWPHIVSSRLKGE